MRSNISIRVSDCARAKQRQNHNMRAKQRRRALRARRRALGHEDATALTGRVSHFHFHSLNGSETRHWWEYLHGRKRMPTSGLAEGSEIHSEIHSEIDSEIDSVIERDIKRDNKVSRAKSRAKSGAKTRANSIEENGSKQSLSLRERATAATEPTGERQ